MKKYHVNPETGRTGECRARVKCEFGYSEEQHFATPEKARASFEATQETKLFPKAQKKTVERKPQPRTNSSQVKQKRAIENFSKVFTSSGVDEYSNSIEYLDNNYNPINMEIARKNPELMKDCSEDISFVMEGELRSDMNRSHMKISQKVFISKSGKKHTANVITTNDGTPVIADFSLCQFNPKLSWPVVSSVSAWERYLEKTLD